MQVPTVCPSRQSVVSTMNDDGQSGDFTSTAIQTTPSRNQTKRAVSAGAKFSSRTRNLAMMMLPVNILFLIFLAPVVLTIYFYSSLGEDKLTLAE